MAMVEREREHRKLADRSSKSGLDAVMAGQKVEGLRRLVEQTEAAGNPERAAGYRRRLTQVQAEHKRVGSEAASAHRALADFAAKG